MERLATNYTNFTDFFDHRRCAPSASPVQKLQGTASVFSCNSCNSWPAFLGGFVSLSSDENPVTGETVPTFRRGWLRRSAPRWKVARVPAGRAGLSRRPPPPRCWAAGDHPRESAL